MYFAGIVVGIAAFARGNSLWVSASVALGSVVAGAALAAVWSTRREPASADVEPREPPSQTGSAIFRLEGEYWTIALDGSTFALADSKGLRYIPRLLERPGVEILALDLERDTQPERVGRRTEDGLTTDAPRPQSVADDEMIRQTEHRIEDLREDIDEARRNNDAERASRAQEQLDWLTDELKRLKGVRGMRRDFPAPTERARTNVQRAIRKAIERIAAQNGSLGHYLDRNIRTGTFCAYKPDENTAPIWTL